MAGGKTILAVEEETELPALVRLRQLYPPSNPPDLARSIEEEAAKLLEGVPGQSRIALAVGSRGITGIDEIVLHLIRELHRAEMRPFVVPAMGSHGGATPEGQTRLLADYGITESALGVPIDARMETDTLGTTDDGIEVRMARAALEADGIIVVNRIKAHTDFAGELGSGLLKMMVVGLGKREGARNFHHAASRLGYIQVLRSSAALVRQHTAVLGGLAIVEDHHHRPCLLEGVPAGRLDSREPELFQLARERMPRLPADEIDLLIVDRIGKNISGSGMDPNVIGRSVHGYSSLLGDRNNAPPHIKRILALDLTPETHGNGIGIGMADFTTDRLVQAIDREVMAINALTAMVPHGAKIPVHFASDRQAIASALASLGGLPPGKARVLHIRDTLNLDTLEASPSLAGEWKNSETIRIESQPAPMAFTPEGHLQPIATVHD